MEKINILEMESINGGSVSGVIGGVCAAIGIATYLKILALSNVAGGVVIGVCLINGIGGSFDWW